jgi:hypothetical protein
MNYAYLVTVQQKSSQREFTFAVEADSGQQAMDKFWKFWNDFANDPRDVYPPKASVIQGILR